MLAVPSVVRRKVAALGAHDWLESLPALVATLQAEWAIDVGAPYAGGTEAFVAEAVMADGTEAVLKVLIPRGGDVADHEITVLRLTGGEGCVGLLRSDSERHAMLLERLGPSMFELGVPIEQRLPILSDLATKLWRPAPDLGLPTGAEKARWLAAFIEKTWNETGRPCTERTIEHALACAARRAEAHDDERAVLVHGDIHQWNALRSADGGYKLVDPDGLLADAEYDLAILMREDPVELLDGNPFERAASLAARHGLDAGKVWEWGVVERVSTGLLCTSIELQPVGREMLHAADVIAAAR